MSESRHDPKRVVKEIIVRYRNDGESSTSPLREFRVWHTGDGAEIDTITWSEKLLKKMHYKKEDGSYIPAEIKNAPAAWKTDLKKDPDPSIATIPINNHCLWLHDDQCLWWSFCGSDS